jgi:hypothetical protein
MSSDPLYLVAWKKGSKMSSIVGGRIIWTRKLRNKLMKKVIGNLISIRRYHSTLPAKADKTSNYKVIYPGAHGGAVRRSTAL